MIYLRLFLEFLKVGLFTFGGAYGSIPIIRETVLGNHWMDENTFADNNVYFGRYYKSNWSSQSEREIVGR